MASKGKILIVEDEPGLVEILTINTKPFDLPQLVSKIEGALGSYSEKGG